jgi:hypothetical protein
MAMLVLLAWTPAATAMCIDVDLRFIGHGAPASLIGTMVRETSSIWETYGVRIEWTTAEGTAQCARPLGSLDVVVDRAHHSSAAPRAILGRTRVMPHRIEHVPIQIDRAATEALIDLLTVEEVFRALGRPRAASTDVGRALGRVLAHEIGHVILAAPDHRRRGLMRPTFLSLDLIRPQREPYTLSPDEVEHLRIRERLLDDQLSGSEAPTMSDGREIAPSEPDAGRGSPASVSSILRRLHAKDLLVLSVTVTETTFETVATVTHVLVALTSRAFPPADRAPSARG